MKLPNFDNEVELTPLNVSVGVNLFNILERTLPQGTRKRVIENFLKNFLLSVLSIRDTSIGSLVLYSIIEGNYEFTIEVNGKLFSVTKKGINLDHKTKPKAITQTDVSDLSGNGDKLKG